MTISGNFERFQCFNFKTNFLEKENLFQKTGVPILVQSTKIENASFSYKTVMSEANVKTNTIVRTKWTYHTEQVLPVTTLFFFENFISV